jgi:hypothetical protein
VVTAPAGIFLRDGLSHGRVAVVVLSYVAMSCVVLRLLVSVFEGPCFLLGLSRACTGGAALRPLPPPPPAPPPLLVVPRVPPPPPPSPPYSSHQL